MKQTDEVLERLSTTYAALRSYSDRGVVLRFHRKNELPDEAQFRTWFIRPDRIRVDWRNHHPYPPLRHLITNHAVCADGSRIWRWQDDPPRMEQESDIGLAFAGAETIAVPNLLLPGQIGAFPFDALNDVHVEEPAVGETPSFCVVGEHPVGGEYRVWVGRSDFLIRKIRTDYRTPVEENDVYTGVTETIYDQVEPNAVVGDDVFLRVGSLLTAG
jgi:hypothetical protein